MAAAVQALVPLGSPPAVCFSRQQFPRAVDSFFHMEHAASILGSESHPEGKQLFHGQSYIKRFWVGGVVLECHNLVSPKNQKKFAFYSESRFVLLGFCSTQAPCAFAVIKRRIPGRDLFSSANILPDFFSIPKIQAICHCQETAILFSSMSRF